MTRVNISVLQIILTKAGGVVQCEVVHHSGPKETPPEEEILSPLLHRPTALLTRLITLKTEKMALYHWYREFQHNYTEFQLIRCYLNDFLLHYRVQPLNEGLHCGVLPQQLFQLLKDADGVIWGLK